MIKFPLGEMSTVDSQKYGKPFGDFIQSILGIHNQIIEADLQFPSSSCISKNQNSVAFSRY